MPCMIVASVMTSNTTSLALFDIIKAAMILVLLLPVVAYLCVRFLPISLKGLYMFMIMFPNVGFMGFPLMQVLFGNKAILSTAIINMGFNLSLFTLGVLVMNYVQGDGYQFNYKSLLSPGVLASLAAILIYIFKIPFPEVITNPLIFMCIQDVMIQGIALIILAMPVANGAVLFAKNYHQDEFLAAKTVFISTFMSIVTIPILVYLLLV